MMTDMHRSTPIPAQDRIKKKILNECGAVQKYIILVAYLNDEPIMGNTKLQKIMFLLSDAVEEVRDDCNYDAGMYGPYSERVAYELNYLTEMGVLYSVGNKIETTPTGQDIAEELLKRERRELIDLLSKYKAFLNDLTINEALAYVYLAYPSMASASFKIDDLKPNMENYIMSLVKKQKISAQRAAELLHISYLHALRKMSKRGIMVFE